MEFFVLMAVSSRTGYLEADVGPKRLASLESNSRYDLVLHEIERLRVEPSIHPLLDSSAASAVWTRVAIAGGRRAKLLVLAAIAAAPAAILGADRSRGVPRQSDAMGAPAIGMMRETARQGGIPDKVSRIFQATVESFDQAATEKELGDMEVCRDDRGSFRAASGT
jgi:hypothetical protein